jgi:hypothetical protein
VLDGSMRRSARARMWPPRREGPMHARGVRLVVPLSVRGFRDGPGLDRVPGFRALVCRVAPIP